MINRKKTLLVGFDAACWGYLNPLLKAGRLPNLQNLMDSGIWGTLQSTMPAWTPTAWSSIVTGKNPGKHGIFDMITRFPGDHESMPTSAKVRRGTSFWKLLNEHGLRVGLVNIPFTFPVEPLDGFIVCGFGTPSSTENIAFPEEILAEIKTHYPGFKSVVDSQVLKSGKPDMIFEAERAHQKTQVQFAVEFAEKYEVDVLVINLMLLDHANHKMPEMEQVNQAIVETDRDLKRLLDAFGPDNVMVISDHGASRIKGKFLLQAWLRDQGYYVQTTRNDIERARALNWIHVQLFRQYLGLPRPLESLFRRVANWTVPRLPDGAAQWYWKRLERAVPFARDHVRFGNLPDYERTKVFPGSVYSGLLYLNVAGHGSSGVVLPEEREALANELADKLRGIVDPDTGEPLFVNVFLSNEVFSGPATAYAPDIILDNYGSVWNVQLTSFTAVSQPSRHRYFLGGGDHGWHSRDGIFVFSGQDFAMEPAATDANLMDLPAILLYLYGVPIPEDYDGRVLPELLAPEFVANNRICFQEGDNESNDDLNNENPYSAEEAEDLLKHLKALGYVE